jgi:hypothetical protein
LASGGTLDGAAGVVDVAHGLVTITPVTVLVTGGPPPPPPVGAVVGAVVLGVGVFTRTCTDGFAE